MWHSFFCNKIISEETTNHSCLLFDRLHIQEKLFKFMLFFNNVTFLRKTFKLSVNSNEEETTLLFSFSWLTAQFWYQYQHLCNDWHVSITLTLFMLFMCTMKEWIVWLFIKKPGKLITGKSCTCKIGTRYQQTESWLNSWNLKFIPFWFLFRCE